MIKTLDAIPEYEDEAKWVDKKKHDVLKVKYKCLKKLFQVYDASVVEYLPEMNPEPRRKHLRRKRSRNQKTDANVDTSELEHGVESTDITSSASVTSAPNQVKPKTAKKKARFRNFVKKVFGIEDLCPLTRTHSDNTIFRKRRRKPLRFGRSRKVPKAADKNPLILNYIQSVQKNCLVDTTARQCPIPGCDMKLCGIINYNDHLNLSHFPQKKHSCTYCHEGFESDSDRHKHEDGHIGINKLNPIESSDTTKISKTDTRASDTQTDSETGYPEKCKRVSFADTQPKGCMRMNQSESILRKSNSKQFLSIFKKKRSESLVQSRASKESIPVSKNLTKECTKLCDSPKDSNRSTTFSSDNTSKTRNPDNTTSNYTKSTTDTYKENSDTISSRSSRTLKNGFRRAKTSDAVKNRHDPVKENINKELNKNEIPTKLTPHPEHRNPWRKMPAQENCAETDGTIKYIPAIIEWSSDETSNLRNCVNASKSACSNKTANVEWMPMSKPSRICDRTMSGSTLKCSVCSKPFDHRWQLASHYNTEHRTKKTSHSVNGSVKTRRSSSEFLNEEGKILIESVEVDGKTSERNFDDSNDVCTNIVYESTSEAEVRKVVELNRISDKTAKSSYKWVRSPKDE